MVAYFIFVFLYNQSRVCQLSMKTPLLQCFDTVGWVIRPVKTVGRITYIVLVQTLNHAQSINEDEFWCAHRAEAYCILLWWLHM